jgi:hypothetical protein
MKARTLSGKSVSTVQPDQGRVAGDRVATGAVSHASWANTAVRDRRARPGKIKFCYWN